MTGATHPDWSAIVSEIRSRGMTMKALARHAGCSMANLYHLLNGTNREPAWSIGERLLDMHRRLCG